MSKRRKVSAEEKIRIAKAFIEGKLGQCEAGSKADVSKSVIADWVRLYLNEGAGGSFRKKKICDTIPC